MNIFTDIFRNYVFSSWLGGSLSWVIYIPWIQMAFQPLFRNKVVLLLCYFCVLYVLLSDNNDMNELWFYFQVSFCLQVFILMLFISYVDGVWNALLKFKITYFFIAIIKLILISFF